MLHRPTTGHLRPRQGRIKRTIRSLLTPEQLNLAIQRESLRVDRKTGGSVVLLLFRFKGAPGAASTMRLIKAILHRIRVSDDVGWFDEQHIGLVLPETATTGAWRLAQHICDRVGRRAPRPHVVMYAYPAEQPSSSDEAAEMPTVIRQTDEPAMPIVRAG